ncbi:hypothetical protein N7462_008168 [Penicillium macrosclerotiorum]|uniref:uncharacterized protein n=1 Tax=Penicillium macrosclerotiorum TaxID=303699 RepID=UPI002548B43D|nr:uncharacterized protein N7462_008168 [Penicillium macrosclerotiorum]KAJ5679924.1 hypothetical protein N7462_008168 [Penicillium macrosclerotiorum]
MASVLLYSLGILVLVAIFSTPVFARSQFQHWYAEYGFIFDRIIQENCTSEYDFYEAGRTNRTYWLDLSRWLGSGPERSEQLTVPLINCIMEACPEFMKSDMASANVLLGLAPGILAVLGSNVDETSLLAVVGKRPFLAIALAAGSPAVVPLRPLEYRSPLEGLRPRDDEVKPRLFSFYIDGLISMLEYAFVVAAIANVAQLSYELGFDTALAFAPGYPYLILLWSFFGPIAHVLAALSLLFRARSIHHVSRGMSLRSCLSQMAQGIGLPSRIRTIRDDIFSDEATFHSWMRWFFIGYSRENLPPKMTIKRENIYILVYNAVLAVMISCHVVLGTLVFSSMLFISARDAVYILGRFMSSVIVCRVVLAYELAKLRLLYNIDDPIPSVAGENGNYHELVTLSHSTKK